MQTTHVKKAKMFFRKEYLFCTCLYKELELNWL